MSDEKIEVEIKTKMDPGLKKEIFKGLAFGLVLAAIILIGVFLIKSSNYKEEMQKYQECTDRYDMEMAHWDCCAACIWSNQTYSQYNAQEDVCTCINNQGDEFILWSPQLTI